MDEGKSSDSAINFRGLSFEEALVRLEKTVQELETGGLTLEDSVRVFEDGMALARFCSHLLASADLKVKRIREMHQDFVESIEEEPDTMWDEESSS